MREALANWRPARVACIVSLLLIDRTDFFLPASRGQVLANDLKENLDLPYNAGGSVEDSEEDPPEIVIFYGQSYEASAIVFALDESGSMGDNGRWLIQSRELGRAIAELGRETQFGIVYYGSRVTTFRRYPVPATDENKKRGKAFVKSRRPEGDTCIGEGVVKALEIARKSEHKYRVVMVTSDGRPDVCGTGDRATSAQERQILANTKKANPGGQVRVHTIYVGRDTERAAIDFLRRLATAHSGTSRTLSQ